MGVGLKPEVVRGAFGRPSASVPIETTAQMGPLEVTVLQSLQNSLNGTPAPSDIQRARDLVQLMLDSCQLDPGGDPGGMY